MIELRVNGDERAEAAMNTPVRFGAQVEVPPQAGFIVAAEWDFQGQGTYPHAVQIDGPQTRLSLSASHAYAMPGTYFPVLRVTSQREGDPSTPYGRVQNLARDDEASNCRPHCTHSRPSDPTTRSLKPPPPHPSVM